MNDAMEKLGQIVQHLYNEGSVVPKIGASTISTPIKGQLFWLNELKALIEAEKRAAVEEVLSTVPIVKIAPEPSDGDLYAARYDGYNEAMSQIEEWKNKKIAKLIAKEEKCK